jgi:phosphatidylethanolamine-binding protein (PEBP) family uncharacterized protein
LARRRLKDRLLNRSDETCIAVAATERPWSFGGECGPCPPPGIHRYFFKLYALDMTLALPPTSKRKVVDGAIKGHIIADATLMGMYARKLGKR